MSHPATWHPRIGAFLALPLSVRNVCGAVTLLGHIVLSIKKFFVSFFRNGYGDTPSQVAATVNQEKALGLAF
jgi:hypothetical protein